MVSLSIHLGWESTAPTPEFVESLDIVGPNPPAGREKGLFVQWLRLEHANGLFSNVVPQFLRHCAQAAGNGVFVNALRA